MFLRGYHGPFLDFYNSRRIRKPRSDARWRRFLPHVAVPQHVRILVFGAAAIGSLFGGLLSRENDVTVVARKAHVDAINRRGLRISGRTTLLAWPTATTEAPAGD